MNTGQGHLRAEHEALVQDLDVSFISILAAGIALTILAVTCCVLAPGRFFEVVMAATLVINIFRIAVCVGLAKGWLHGVLPRRILRVHYHGLVTGFRRDGRRGDLLECRAVGGV